MYDCRIGLNTDVQSLHWSSQWCAIRFAQVKTAQCGYKVPRQAVLCMIIYNYVAWYLVGRKMWKVRWYVKLRAVISLYMRIYIIYSLLYIDYYSISATFLQSLICQHSYFMRCQQYQWVLSPYSLYHLLQTTVIAINAICHWQYFVMLSSVYRCIMSATARRYHVNAISR